MTTDDRPGANIVLQGPMAALAMLGMMSLYVAMFAFVFAVMAFPFYIIGYVFDVTLWALTGKNAPFAVDIAGGVAVLSVVGTVAYHINDAIARWKRERRMRAILERSER